MSHPIVSFVAAGFGPEAAFEGRIVAELERFEQSGLVRVLDLLFVHRLPSGELESRPGLPGRRTMVSQADVDEAASGLEPGQAAGLVLLEHVWAADLDKAVTETGGEILQHGLLEPEQAQALVE
jgi:Family of unknown function (DUF6325)